MMKSTKHFFVLLIALFMISAPKVQAQSFKHELGLRLTGLNNFDFIYKKGKGENRYTRYRLAFTSISYKNTTSDGIINFSSGFAIGFEKRKKLADKLYFAHGIEPFLRFNYDRRGEEFMVGVLPGIGYVLGFQYNFVPNFYVGLETIPSINTSLLFNNDGFNEVYSINAGFNTNLVALSLVYRFDKNKK